jgi:putative copper resistance protein D
LLCWATLLVVLLAINWIWTGDAIQVGTFAFAALAVYLGGFTLWLVRREALHKGPPPPRSDPEAVPEASLSAVAVGLAIGCILCGRAAQRACVREAGGEGREALSSPSVLRLLVSDWHPAWYLVAEAVVVASFYVVAARRVPGWPARCTVAFLAGIGVVLVALGSGLERFDDRLLSAHMLQHLLLLLGAPLLLLAGRPVVLAMRILPRRPRARLASALRRGGALAHPAAALALFYLVVLGTQVPAVVDAALRDPALHEAEHAAYLLTGVLFLWPLFGVPGPRPRLGGLGSFGYVIAAMPACALVGAYLNRASTIMYSPYGPASRQLGISGLADQAQAGAIMWVGAHVFLIAIALSVLLVRLRVEERRQRARDAALQRLAIDPPASGGVLR